MKDCKWQIKDIYPKIVSTKQMPNNVDKTVKYVIRDVLLSKTYTEVTFWLHIHN